MKESPIPENENERLQDLKGLCLLDTPPEERFDRLTRIAKSYFDVDACLVTLVDSNRLQFKSNHGFDAQEIPRNTSFCGHTLLTTTPLIIEDALKDPRFADNPYVTGSHNVRFYAGVPISGPNNTSIGTFCIVNCKARKFSDADLKILTDLSILVQEEILPTNIAYRKQQHREPDSKLRAILDNVLDGIITIDKKGIVETMNHAAVKLFGYSEDEVIGNNLKMLMPDRYKPLFDEFLKLYQATGVTKIIGPGWEVAGKRKDGTSFPMELAVSEMIYHNQHGFTGIVKDITKKKQQESIQKKFESIVQSSTDAIISTTPEGIFTSWNVGAEKMFGYSEAEVLNQSYRILVPPELLGELEKKLIEAIPKMKSGETIENFETQRLTKQGKPIDISISVSPITNKDGKLVELSSIFRDITEQKKWTQKLVRAKEEAEQASISKTQFVANMSHEIRTPLNAILGMSRIIANTELSQEQSNYLDMIQSSGKSLLGIINDILDFSKIEAGKMELSCTDFMLSDLMSSVANVMSVNTGEKNLELVIDIDKDTPTNLYGDIQRIQQILTNLVSNSIKFTETGEIVVSVDANKLIDGVRQLKFAIKDTGIGMSDEQQLRLFSPFSQADTSITRRYGGSGLGLVITKRFVELMEGTIGVTSTLGTGTEVIVEIPVKIGDATGSNFERKADMANLRLLVVDDNEASRNAITHGIESIGWQVDVLESGHKLENWLKQQFYSGIRYDLLLIDMTLPGEDTISIVSTIENEFKEYDLPAVLMANAFRQDQIHQSQTPLNQQNILIKPITISNLFDYACEKIPQNLEKGLDRNMLETEPDLNGIHVLVVEDNRMNQIVAKSLLDGYGATADIANHGEEAIDMLRGKNHDYDIVLMDVQMPVMDGFTATKIIREELQLNIPILALSAGVLNSERESCTQAGMNDFVAKPIDAAILYSTIARHLPEQGKSVRH